MCSKLLVCLKYVHEKESVARKPGSFSPPFLPRFLHDVEWEMGEFSAHLRPGSLDQFTHLFYLFFYYQTLLSFFLLLLLILEIIKNEKNNMLQIPVSCLPISRQYFKY